MGHIVLFDTNQPRLRKTGEIIDAHIVTCTRTLDGAYVNSRVFRANLVVADGTESDWPRLIRKIRTQWKDGARCPVVLIVTDPGRGDLRTSIREEAADWGVHEVVFRNQRDDLQLYLNNAINRGLLLAWLLETEPRPFPFDPSVVPVTAWTRLYLDSPLTKFVGWFGGWSILRSATDWGAFADDPNAFVFLLAKLYRLGERLERSRSVFLTDLLLRQLGLLGSDESAPVQEGLRDIVRTIPFEGLVSAN